MLDEFDGLAPAEVGIVADSAHRGGYHCGRDRLVTNDYSNRHARDKAGLSDYASALDVGTFSMKAGGKTHTLPTWSVWVVKQCVANTPDSRDIREVIYSADGRTVKRWDRLGRSTTGDDSHLWHTHISVFRDATKAGRGLTPLMQRYLVEIRGEEADDMTPEEHKWLHALLARNQGETDLLDSIPSEWSTAENPAPDVLLNVKLWKTIAADAAATKAQVAALTTVVGKLADQADVDAIVAAVKAEGDKAAERSADDAARDAELLAAVREFENGGATAEEVVGRVAAILAGAANPAQ
jgi:hypothetical protein